MPQVSSLNCFMEFCFDVTDSSFGHNRKLVKFSHSNEKPATSRPTKTVKPQMKKNLLNYISELSCPQF